MRINTTVTQQTINCPKDGAVSKQLCSLCEHHGGTNTNTVGAGVVVICNYKPQPQKEDLSQEELRDKEDQINHKEQSSKAMRNFLLGNQTKLPFEEEEIKSSFAQWSEKNSKDLRYKK